MTKPTKAFAVPALLAVLALSATPAAATELPVLTSDAPTQVSATVGNYGGGWGGRHRYRHRGRTGAGDVLGAVLVLGTIAAVASAASKANRARGYPYPERYPYPYPNRYPDQRGDYRPDTPRGIEGAADLCLREIERDARVEDVARVERNASGWLVTGSMADGAGFTCSIGADGRIERIAIGGRASLPRDYEARSEGGDERYRGADTRYADDDDDYRGGEVSVEAQADGGPLRDYPGAEVEADAQADDRPLRDYPNADGEEERGPLRDYPGGPVPGDPAGDDAVESEPES